VHLERMPQTVNGKLNRKALPAPAGDAYRVCGYEAPQGEIETAMAEIWSEVLKVEQVGRHDNFFRLGGHSLLAVRVVERMRGLGWQLDVRTLFANPTVAELAAGVGNKQKRIEVPANRIPQPLKQIPDASETEELRI
jgi:aryl carrier-like protein